MQLLKSEDPRDKLQKATRDELVDFAHAKGQKDITDAMPKVLIVAELRKRGLTNIPIPDRTLGFFHPKDSYGLVDIAASPAVNADEAFISQWKTTKDEPHPLDPDTMSMQDLRKECKRLNIKMERTDNLARLREKLRGQNAA